MDPIVTDGHDGLLAAVGALFAATPRQRCVVHKELHVMSAIPKRERSAVTAGLTGIWKSPTKEEALIELAVWHQASTRSAIPKCVRNVFACNA